LRTSPSQHVLFRKCPRAWYWKYVMRLPEVRRNRRGRGDRVHALLAAVLGGRDHDRADPILEVARPVLRLEPPPLVEVKVQSSEGAFEIAGKVDALYLDPGTLVPEVHDHKTFAASGRAYLASGRPGARRWIGEDAQMLCYAAILSRATGFSRPVVVRHNQIPVEPGLGPAREVHAEIPAERCRAEWSNLLDEASIMKEIAGGAEPGDVWEGDACRTCDQRGLCGGQESIEEYVRRAEAPELDGGDVFG